MTGSERFNLVLRILMELGIVGGLAWWGVATGDSTASKVVLGVGAPVVGFGLWGAIDFHQAGHFAEPLRLAEELVISFLAAAAWYAAGRQIAGVALAAVSLVFHASVYASGQRLLKTNHPSSQPNAPMEEGVAR